MNKLPDLKFDFSIFFSQLKELNGNPPIVFRGIFCSKIEL